MKHFYRVRDEVGQWAATHHEAELLQGVRDWLDGAVDPQPEFVNDAVVFALIVSGPDGGPSLLERWLRAARKLPRTERLIAEQLAGARFAIVRVVEATPSLRVQDVLTERVHTLAEERAVFDLYVGDWHAGFFYGDGERWDFDGVAIAVADRYRIDMVQALLAGFAAAGVAPRAATAADTRRVARAAVQQFRAALRQLVLVTADAELSEIRTSYTGVTWLQARDVMAGWPDVEVTPSVIGVYGDDPVAWRGARVVRALFIAEGGGATLLTNSRRRYDAILARWEQATGSPLPILREDLPPQHGLREGTRRVLDMDVSPTPMPELEAEWRSTPLPELGGICPLDALAAGRRAEVRAVLAEDERGKRHADALGFT